MKQWHGLHKSLVNSKSGKGPFCSFSVYHSIPNRCFYYICKKITAMKERKMALFSRQIHLKDPNQEIDDLAYWLAQSPQQRLHAVTIFIRQNMKQGQRMDKSIASKRITRHK
jgi:hypothetical protein